MASPLSSPQEPSAFRGLPFAVRLHFGGRMSSYTRTLRRFSTDPAQAEIDETYIQEYRPCALEFVAQGGPPPEDARLYMDGFDVLVDEGLAEEDGRVYLPCGRTVWIQPGDDEGDRRGSGYPWIPGNYRIEVRWQGRSYYTVVEVRPKDLSRDQLRLMREELERWVVGLTLDIVRRNQGMGRTVLDAQLPPRFYQYQLLERHFPKISAALQDIVRKPKHEVRKVHRVVRAETTHHRDERSYRWRHSAAGYARNGASASGRARFVLAPDSEVHYDLPENRWIRRIVSDLMATIDDIVAALERLMHPDDKVRRQVEREKERQLAAIRRLQSRLRAVLTEPVFRQVADVAGPLPLTPAMQRDGRYRALYRFWSDLKSHFDPHTGASFAYQWKKTDLLWEYWVFVRVIEALKQLGFTPTGGWVFEQPWKFPDRVYIPTIPEGTRVTLERGGERIDVFYADKLPTFRDEAVAAGARLYALGRHNWPDIRLDYYENGVYQYSLIGEAKYRKLRTMVPSAVERNPARWQGTIEQLRAYRDAVYLVDDGSRRPVDEVFVLYPGDEENPLIYASPVEITFVQLVPGRPDTHFVELLAQRWPIVTGAPLGAPAGA